MKLIMVTTAGLIKVSNVDLLLGLVSVYIQVLTDVFVRVGTADVITFGIDDGSDMNYSGVFNDISNDGNVVASFPYL